MKLIHLKRAIRPLVLALAIGATPAAALASASSATAAPFCGIVWGSLAKSASRAGDPTITNARAGQHGCFDRLVIDFRGKGANATVRYVSQVLDQGRGAPIPLRGGAKIEIVVRGGPFDIETGAVTYHFSNPSELVDVTGFRTFRQVAWGGSFEGYTTFALGVRARLPFQVFTLDGPGSGSRLVIDVAHLW